MPSPQDSSLINTIKMTLKPHNDWLALATSHKECLSLINDLKGVPTSWLEWVDEEVKTRIKHGVYIEKPLNYRMKTLWNGIILLQEGKYICDVVETSFRQLFANQIIENSISFQDLIDTIPSWEKLRAQFETVNHVININDLISMEFISHFTFYQLTETISRNWKHIVDSSPRKPGFKQGINNGSCRDVNIFRRDMKIIRDKRNAIAHSKKLFTPEEIKSLHKISTFWLNSIGIDLELKITTYRLERPRFLEPF